VLVVALIVAAAPVASAPPASAPSGAPVPSPAVRAAGTDDPVVAAASTGDGGGYWLVTARGVVQAFGTAAFHGDLRAIPLTRPVVGIAATASSQGYWLVAGDGGIFSFGDAPFHGSTGHLVLNQPVVSMAPTPTGGGYWMVATDGGIFSFGDAPFRGSTGHLVLNRPVNGMTVSPTGEGYRMVADDGGIFSFGDAPFYGSTGAAPPPSPIVGMAPAPGNTGYWTVTSDGQVFAFGSAPHLGDLAGQALRAPVVGLAANPAAPGYLIVLADGQAARFGAGAPPPGAGTPDGGPAPGPPPGPDPAPPPGPHPGAPPEPPPTGPTVPSPNRPARYTVTATLDPSVTTGRTIPTDFVGLSLEWNLVEDYLGRGPGTLNEVVANLVTTLSPAGSLRLGGRSQDRTCYGGHTFRQCDMPVLQDRHVDTLAAFLRRTGWRAIVGVNLAKDDDPAHAMQAAMVGSVVARAGDVVEAFELGNEPHFYASPNQWPVQPPPRPAGYDEADIVRDFEALADDLPAGIAVAGPSASALQPLGEWFAAGPRLDRLGLVTLHMYAAHRTSTGERACTADNLLHEGLMRHWMDGSVSRAASIAAARGTRARLAETTPCSGSGLAGVTDRQVAALWTLDWVLEAARAGVAGVNAHIHDPPGVGDGTAHYDPIVSAAVGNGHRVSVNPNYYALAMLRPALGGRLLGTSALTVADWGGLPRDEGYGVAAGRSGHPLKFHVVRTGSGAAVRRTVFVVNKEPASANVVLRAGAGCLAEAPTLVRLTNPDGLAGTAAGTTLGARRVDGTAGPLTRGVLAPPVRERLAPAGGAVTVHVGVGEAVAVTFTGCGS